MSEPEPCPSADSHADVERLYLNPDTPGQREWLREQAQIGMCAWRNERGIKRKGNVWDDSAARTEG